MVVGRKDRRLYDVNPAPPDVFLDADEQIALGETHHFPGGGRHLQMPADRARELGTPTSAEDQHVVGCHG